MTINSHVAHATNHLIENACWELSDHINSYAYNHYALAIDDAVDNVLGDSAPERGEYGRTSNVRMALLAQVLEMPRAVSGFESEWQAVYDFVAARYARYGDDALAIIRLDISCGREY